MVKLLVLTIMLGLLVTGTVSLAGSEELTIKRLNNSKYLIPSLGNSDQEEWVLLKDGEYHRDNTDNPLSVKIVALTIGYLSNTKTKDAAVIYGFSRGGTGFFVFLCAVINDRGELKKSNLVTLEDRVKINSLRIKSGKIIIDMLAHHSTDPAPFPTLKKVGQYSLVDNKLVEIGSKTK
jgi:hypothetical protein